MKEVRNILIGLEILEETSQLCYYDRKAKEAVSIPLKVGTNIYKFPTKLLKMKDKDVWHYGLEAEYFAKIGRGTLTGNPLRLAMEDRGETVSGKTMAAWEIMAAYLRETLKLFGLPDIAGSCEGICITTEKMNLLLSRNLKKALIAIGFRSEQIMLQDQKESFYYYCYSQKPAVWTQHLALICFKAGNVSFSCMSESLSAGTHLVSIEKVNEMVMPLDNAEKDEKFAEFVRKCIKDDGYSGIFITGEGFGKEWADMSIKTMVDRSRYVFEGEELFVKGACYALLEHFEKHLMRNRVYLGAEKVPSSVLIDVTNGGMAESLPLIQCGKNWYDNGCEIDIILDAREDIVVTQMSRDGRRRKQLHIGLDELPKRPNRATRLRLRSECTSAVEGLLTVEDLGFGELYPASHKTWSMKLSLENTLEHTENTQEGEA